MTESIDEHLERLDIPRNQKNKKMFVLDTNAPINDPECFYNFGDNILIIPYHTMITELNNVHKKTQKPITSHNCMEALAKLKEIKDKADKEGVDLKKSGVKVNEKGGMIYFLDESRLSPQEKLSFSADLGKGDEMYLECTRKLKERFEPLGYEVVLVTNDFALHVHANFNDLKAETLKRGTVEIKDLLRGYDFCLKPEILSDIFHDKNTDIPFEKFDSAKLVSGKHIGDLPNNNYVIFLASKEDIDRIDAKNSYSILEKYSKMIFRVDRVEKLLRPLYYNQPHLTVSGIRPKNLEQWLFLNNCLEPEISLSVGYGHEGTGKTFLELAAAMNISRRNVQEFTTEEAKVKGPLVFLTKPLTSIEEYGYLPGDLEAKLDPSYSSYMRNLRKICANIDKNQSSISFPKGKNKNLQEFGFTGIPPSIDEVYKSFEGILRGTESNAPLVGFLPLGIYRGINISPGEVLIIDEMQNTESRYARTMLSRSEEGSKTYVTGCPWQVDNPFLRAYRNGLLTLIYAIQHTNLDEHPDWNFSAVMQLKHQERGRQSEWASEMLNNI